MFHKGIFALEILLLSLVKNILSCKLSGGLAIKGKTTTGMNPQFIEIAVFVKVVQQIENVGLLFEVNTEELRKKLVFQTL